MAQVDDAPACSYDSNASDSGDDSDDQDIAQPGFRHTSDLTSGLNFINDDVAAGIKSYLHLQQSKDTFVVYNRSAAHESERRRDKLQKVTEDANRRRKARETGERQAPRSGSDLLLDPFGGRPGKGKLGPCVPPTAEELQFEHFATPDGKQRLSFNSSFESGNLALAQSRSPSEYLLLVDEDVNTRGYTQWFYFAVQGGTMGMTVHFQLVNLSKPSSLFGDKGMRPVVWSERSNRGWERGCTNIQYHTSTSSPQKTYHTLSFEYTFEYEEDTVFFAYHYPYTFSYLQDVLDTFAAHPYAGKFLHRKMLCKTVGDLPCDLLEISEDGVEEVDRGLAVITARVHPGESNASWMMHGFLRFLLSPAVEAVTLRRSFTWLIVPMLNPDGVLHGNYRCGLAGSDLNRCYLDPHKLLNPTVWHIKGLMKDRKVDVFIDMHGHSKKEGVFFYGGKVPHDDERNARIRLIPRLCTLGSEDFKWNECAFNVHKSKTATARLVAFLELNIDYAYTVEASFWSNGKVQGDAGVTRNFAGEDDQDEVADRRPSISSQGLAEAAAAALLQKRPLGIARARRNTENTLDNMFQMVPSDGESLDASEPVSPAPYSPVTPISPESAQVLVRRSLQDALRTKDASGMHADEREGSGPDARSFVDTASGEFPDYCPARLELVGPTIGRAICVAWQLDCQEKPIVPTVAPALKGCFLAGSEAERWPHLRYDVLTNEVVQKELARLLLGRVATEAEEGDDGGSDSNPSADECPKHELGKLRKLLLRSLRKRRKTVKKKPSPEPAAEEPQPYKIVVAFGKTLKMPIKADAQTIPCSPEQPSSPVPVPRKRRASVSGHEMQSEVAALHLERPEQLTRRRHSTVNATPPPRAATTPNEAAEATVTHPAKPNQFNLRASPCRSDSPVPSGQRSTNEAALATETHPAKPNPQAFRRPSDPPVPSDHRTPSNDRRASARAARPESARDPPRVLEVQRPRPTEAAKQVYELGVPHTRNLTMAQEQLDQEAKELQAQLAAKAEQARPPSAPKLARRPTPEARLSHVQMMLPGIELTAAPQPKVPQVAPKPVQALGKAYGTDDIRGFVDVASLKPNTGSASGRLAWQLQQTVGISFKDYMATVNSKEAEGCCYQLPAAAVPPERANPIPMHRITAARLSDEAPVQRRCLMPAESPSTSSSAFRPGGHAPSQTPAPAPAPAKPTTVSLRWRKTQDPAKVQTQASKSQKRPPDQQHPRSYRRATGSSATPGENEPPASLQHQRNETSNQVALVQPPAQPKDQHQQKPQSQQQPTWWWESKRRSSIASPPSFHHHATSARPARAAVPPQARPGSAAFCVQNQARPASAAAAVGGQATVPGRRILQ